MAIISFRGMVADGGQEIVPLHTNDGSTGYKIVKFEIMPHRPGVYDQESVMKIYTIEQTTVDGVVDFSDQTLLASAFYSSYRNAGSSPNTIVEIFDNMIFNQDIYITFDEVGTHITDPFNYYIELESMPLSLDESTVATLKDIRNIKSG